MNIPTVAGVLLLQVSSLALHAQTTLKGVVLDNETGEPLIGANIIVKGIGIGTATDWDGSFILQVEQEPPFTLEVSYTGFTSTTIEVTDPGDRIRVMLGSETVIIESVEVKGQRILERQKMAPLTVESLDLIAIRETPSNDFYEGLGNLKGVDLTTASLGFTIINTRGFNSTSPVRSLQLIDGVDNQAPGLNFSLGNFLGAPELDVLKVDLIHGASSSFYGPNAFNGVIDIQTKDPFFHQGLSVNVKAGERKLFKGMFRYAKAFQNQDGEDIFAFKINGYYFQADDWKAVNYDPTFQSDVDQSNPGGYDAVNIYGDENLDNSRKLTGLFERIDLPGIGIFHRRGYRETDLVDYKTENFKGNVGLYYNLTPEIQAVGGVNIGSGTTVYQGENRFRLKDIFFWQAKLEVKQRDKFFIRAYMTREDAGNSFDAYATALALQNTAKIDSRWTQDYKRYWQSFVNSRVRALEGYPTVFPFDFEQQDSVLMANQDSLFAWHNEAQSFANKKSVGVNNLDFFEPGTAEFENRFNEITGNLANDPDNPGTKFYDKSALYHIQGEYIFNTPYIKVTTGGNYRLYTPDSKGTIFSDTGSVEIRNHEYGLYLGARKEFLNKKLTLNATLRMDKNENFNYVFSPATSIVYTPNKSHFFRMSFSSALRNPTLSDQYLYLDVGRAQLVGNISGYNDLVTPESFRDFLDSRVKDTLDYFSEPPIEPEKVKTVEIGYRGALFEKFWIDMGYYYSWYRDFIGYKIGIDMDFDPVTNFVTRTEILRISSNSESQVTTQGFSVGANYYLGTFLNLNGNYSWNVLNKSGERDPIIPAFNTPEHKFNIGITGREMPVTLGGRTHRSFGFSVNYKWIEGFFFEGSPQFTGPIPTYDLVDVQVNWHFKRLNLTAKIGASNVLNKMQYQTYGGPRIGRLAYISLLYEHE